MLYRYLVAGGLLLAAAACSTSQPPGAATGPTPRLGRPERDFETFWTTFRDHYAFFRLKQVDWDQQYAQYRPQVTRRTSQAELLAVLQQLVTPLRDGHINISKGEQVLFSLKKPSYFKEEFKGQEAAYWQTSNQALQRQGFGPVQGVGPAFKDVRLYYVARTPGAAGLGYLRLTRCFGRVESLFDDQREAADQALMLRQLDSLLGTLADTRGLILDLRGNGGGHGGEELARRFCPARTLTHYKAVRQPGGYEQFTPLQPVYLAPVPAGGVQYLKPVVILTNDKTASSAEDFTIGLYRLPQVTTVGANTSGMLSDMYSGELSGGLSFTLSNQRYYSVDTLLLEDVGVPARVPVVSPPTTLAPRQDPVIEAALRQLSTSK
jgi:carboxyl-terminal processing protease